MAAALDTNTVFVATEDEEEAALASSLLRRAGLRPLSQAWGRRGYSEATARGRCKPEGGGPEGGDVFTRIEEAMAKGSVTAHADK